MENKKLEIALVYLPQEGPPGIRYENDDGIIYNYQSPNRDMINVGMGFYSIPDPQPQDSLLAIEPFCVHERDYDLDYNGKYKHIFTWTARAFVRPEFKGKIVEINHPSCQDPPEPNAMVAGWKPWNERANEIVFIANNKNSSHGSSLYEFRIQLADLLHKHSKYKVSWYGQIPINRPYYRGTIEHKNEVLGSVKFSVCTENCYDPIYSHNYFTEKMPEVWFSGAIPIYMGCHNINSFGFAEHSYIDLRTYCPHRKGGRYVIDYGALLSRIESFDEKRYRNYRDDVLYNINKKENSLYSVISFDRMYDRIIQTIKNDS